jgi:peptidoglycan hydrolase-like protein with peptidoglycan-binding domain
MIKVRNVAAALAISSVAALPACSMFGASHNGQASRTSYPGRSYATSQQGYPSPQSPELSQDTIQKVQDRLQQQGAYHGRVDGVWGPGTESAVRTYQQQHNLNASGKLDVDTMASLNLGTNQNYGTAQQPSDQRYGSNYNPPPNANPASGNNPPPADTNQPNVNNPR